MIPPRTLAALLHDVAIENDDRALLQRIVEQIREHTSSRNILLAEVNDEHGCLEVTHGAGADWTGDKIGTRLPVDVASRAGLVAYVAATGDRIVLGDVKQAPWYREVFGSTRSEIAIPVVDGNSRIRAVINAEADRPDAYSPDDVEVCEVFASVVGIILDRQERRARELALIEVGKALHRATTEEDLLERFMSVAGGILRLQACSVFLYDEASDAFVLRASVGRLRDKIGRASYRIGEGVTGSVCESGKPVRLDRPQEDERWLGKFVEFPNDEIAAFLAVPIVIRGRTLGVIRALRQKTENTYLDNRFTDGDENVLSAISEQLAAGLENVRGMRKMLHTERMAAWGELSARSSHMIGNRVFALKGDVNELGHLVRDPAPNAEALRELQASLSTNVQRIEEILLDFRDFLTATQLTTTTVDLASFVTESLPEIFPKRSRVALDWVEPDAPCLALADPKRLRRALAELIENALSFMEEGTLTLRVGPATPEEIRRAKTGSGRFWSVRVRDTGPGVPDDLKDRIFSPFFSGRVRGMGLGLSIVKGIVEAHGGSVIETGVAGQGAEFVVLLPIAERPNSQEP